MLGKNVSRYLYSRGEQINGSHDLYLELEELLKLFPELSFSSIQELANFLEPIDRRLKRLGFRASATEVPNTEDENAPLYIIVSRKKW